MVIHLGLFGVTNEKKLTPRKAVYTVYPVYPI